MIPVTDAELELRQWAIQTAVDARPGYGAEVAVADAERILDFVCRRSDAAEGATRPSAPPAWETAPKDGSVFLASFGDRYASMVPAFYQKSHLSLCWRVFSCGIGDEAPMYQKWALEMLTDWRPIPMAVPVEMQIQSADRGSFGP